MTTANPRSVSTDQHNICPRVTIWCVIGSYAVNAATVTGRGYHEAMLDQVTKLLDDNRQERLDRLFEFLRIDSVSTDPSYASSIRRAAEYTAEQLRECGLEAEILPTASHPCVLAWDPDPPAEAPKMLFYGHYDVQPPDPLEKWTSPPFEPEVRNGAIHARGASDDKGQVACFIEAVRAWHQAHGKLPVGLTVLIEGDEECGSAALDPFIREHHDRLDADVAVVSDTGMWDAQTPAICYGLRGLLYFDLELHGPGRDLHSGMYGGSVANPLNELAKVLGRLFDDDHRITIPGFYDDVAAPAEEELAEWQKLGFSDEQWAASIGMNATHGEAGCSTLVRRWARPSCDINGLYGGYAGEGAKTVIPTHAGAKVSFRLAPEQEPATIAESFHAWLGDRTPPGCRWQIREFARATPVMIDRSSPYLAAAKEAMQAGFGSEPVLIREGATIPVVGTFKQLLGLDTLLVGLGRQDDAIHSPNEKFDLECFEAGCRTHAALIEALGRMGAASR